MAKATYKILSFSTTMRNPQRIADFLKALVPFENQILTHSIIMQIVANLIKTTLYVPLYASRNFKNILDVEMTFSDEQVAQIIQNSPQKHKESGFDIGWDSRFDTWYKLPMEFGFCFYEMNKPLIISNTGHLLIESFSQSHSNDEKIADIFLSCMMKFQPNNPFRKVLNANVPLMLLLNVMKELKKICGDSKIHKDEISFFLCWKNSDIEGLTRYILNFRKAYISFKYSKDIIYEKCLEILESNNTKRFKKSQICAEAIDEYIRKMRITGIVSLRGNGLFLDINSFEMEKIEYALKHYSPKPKAFANKDEYLAYMGEIDKNILDFKESKNIPQKENIKLKTLENFAKNYTKTQIFNELKILNNKNTKSKDEVFKFIPEPTRFEFLTSIALKQNFHYLQVLPNYSVDDEGLPKSYAGGNQPDIICIDRDSKSIVEVSLICGRNQTTLELLPITRHLKESKNDFAIFIAPSIFEDSKRYVKFIKSDENLDIRNLNILEFIDKLKQCKYIKNL